MGKMNFSFNRISNYIKNLKFVRKIQFGFFIIAMISTFIATNDYTQITEMEGANQALFNEFVNPSLEIQKVYTEFQKLQFLMLKFSIPEFADNFSNDVKSYNALRAVIDESLAKIQSYSLGEEVNKNLKSVNDIWGNYKNVVADAIVSASASKSYDMAAIISVTSGEEVGTQLVKEFDGVLVELKNTSDILKADMNSAVEFTRMMIIVGAIFGALIFFFSVFYLAPRITKPIKTLIDAISEFSLGNFFVDIPIKTKDEFGQLAENLVKLEVAQQEKIKAAENIAAGNFEKVKVLSDKDVLAIAFNKEIDMIEGLIAEAQKLIEANELGNLEVRGNVQMFPGSWKKIIEGINSILVAIITPIRESSEVLEAMSNGDYTIKVTGDYKGDYEIIKNSLNKLQQSLNEIINRMTSSTNNLANSASQISASSEQIAKGSSEQSMQTNEVTNSIEQMTETIIETSKNAAKAAENAKLAGQNAESGGQVVEETVTGINKIAVVVEEAARTVKELGTSSNQIGKIIQVIEDIADQTNLLALNAAIEAARAGDQGRGFAVVADEVRKLAERTTKATKEISQMIKKIQIEVEGVIDSMDKGTDEVEKGKLLAGKAGETLREIITSSVALIDIVNQVAAASEEQSSAAEQISQNIEFINNVTNQTSSGIQEIAGAAEDMYTLTLDLGQFVSNFRTESSEDLNFNYNFRENKEYADIE